jgi:hypothetical protein
MVVRGLLGATRPADTVMHVINGCTCESGGHAVSLA